MLLYSAWLHSPNDLECNVLPAGYVHLKYGRFDIAQVNPPLSRMLYALPLLAFDVDEDWNSFSRRPELRPEYGYGADFVRRNARALRPMLFACRAVAVLFSVVGAVSVYLIARRMYGPRAGFVAVVYWCFSPMVLGHGATVGHDVAGAAVLAATFFLYLGFYDKPTLRRAVLLGLAGGLTLLTRTTCAPALGLMLISFLAAKPSESGSHERWHRGGLALLVAAVALYVLNAGYGFNGTMTRLREYEFFSRAFSGEVEATGTGNRFRGTILGAVALPLPRDFVQGLDLQQRDFESPPFPSYLCGEWRERGWWSYYLVAWAVKTPIGFQLLFGLAVLRIAGRWIRREAGPHEHFTLTTVVLVFAVASFQCGFTIHYRYVMPAFPFIAVLIGGLWADGVRGRIRIAVTTVLLAWGVISSLGGYPHNLAYFNAWAGGSRNGPRYLLHSSCDWGQNVYQTMSWYDEVRATSGKEVFILTYGVLQPHMLDVRVADVPTRSAPSQQRLEGEAAIRPGIYAVSVAHVFAEHGHYRYFSRFEPVSYIGPTTRVYELSEADLARGGLNSISFNEL